MKNEVQWLAEYGMEVAKVTISDEVLEKVIHIFCHNLTQLPQYIHYIDANGKESFGFYISYIFSTLYSADPSVFRELLKIDKQIGWTAMARNWWPGADLWTDQKHIEEVIFRCKVIKIIEDKEVRKNTK